MVLWYECVHIISIDYRFFFVSLPPCIIDYTVSNWNAESTGSCMSTRAVPRNPDRAVVAARAGMKAVLTEYEWLERVYRVPQAKEPSCMRTTI